MTVLWSKCDLSVSKITLYHLVHLSVIISLWDSESLLILRASVSWTNEIEVKPEKKNTPLSDYVQTADLKVEKNNFAITFDNFAKLVLHPVVLLWNPETSSNTISRNADCGEETRSGWGLFFSEVELSMMVNLTHFRWGILFSHPRDYTPVCTTELGRAARLSSDFSKRNVKLIALSVDFLEDHHGWAKVL